MDRRAIALVVAFLLTTLGCAPPNGETPLAFVGSDGEVYTLSLADGVPTRISGTLLQPPRDATATTYEWPTWSADGRMLAYLRFHRDAQGIGRSAVLVSRADGSNAKVLYEGVTEGDHVRPFFLAWSPDSSLLAVGAQGRQEVHVLLLDPTGSHPARTMTTGSPVFYAWSPSSASLLVHPFGDARVDPRAEISLFHLSREWNERFVLPAQPVGFRVPAWSPDGKRVVVAATDIADRTQLLLFDTEGGATTSLMQTQGNPAFTWSPDGSHLAVARRDRDRSPLYAALEVLSAPHNVRTEVATGELLAFFWSPDGTRLAYAMMAARDNPGITWWGVDADGQHRAPLGAYRPESSSFFVMTFFDQYAESMSPWSPDGRYFVVSGALQGEADQTSRVYVVPIDGSSPPRAVAEGKMASWPPVRGR